MTRWGTITWRELLHETRWLDEDDSTRLTRRGDDSKRTTRRGSLDKARWFDETTLSHNQEWIPKVVRVVCEGHLFCEWCCRVFFFLGNVQSIINDIYGQSIVLTIIDTFRFILLSIIILSAFLPANFVTWMIMVLIVFSILFQDHEFNAPHKHSCAFPPCVQIYISTF